MIDKHKQDYLHAEGPKNGQIEGWTYDENCTCDACMYVGYYPGGVDAFALFWKMFSEQDKIDDFDEFLHYLDTGYQIA